MPENQWDATLYDQKHAFISEYGKSLIPLLAPRKGERVLDLGCGSGHLAHEIAEAGAEVIGIDRSQSMIVQAKAAYPEMDFRVADARTFAFDHPFDAVFSNATLHWVREADQVVERIVAALKPGGRLVLEMGGKGNILTIAIATEKAAKELGLIAPDFGWYFPSIGEYASLLEQHGLIVQTALLFERPTPLEEGEHGLRNWLAMFGGKRLNQLPEDQKEQLLTRTQELARPVLFQDGRWIADYRRLRIVALKALSQ